jgi:U3 small nucleolar RNA-associated protein 14
MNEQLLLAEKLRRKIAGRNSDSDPDDDSLDDDDSDALVERFEEEAEKEMAAPTKGLMSLKFMQRAQEKSKKEAEELLRTMQVQEDEFAQIPFDDDEEEEVEEKPKKEEKKEEEEFAKGRRSFGGKVYPFFFL